MSFLRRTSLALSLAALQCLTPLHVARAQTQGPTPRATFPKPAYTKVDATRVDPGTVVLKFAEGTRVRLREGRLVPDFANRTADELARMQRLKLTDNQLQADVTKVNDLLAADPSLAVARLFVERSEEALAAEKYDGEKQSSEELADLDLYFHLTRQEPDTGRAEALVNALNALPSVELAYPKSMAVLPDFDHAPVTGLLVEDQGYLRSSAASNGIDAEFAWTFPGGRGAGVRFVDIERGWHLGHEDLPQVFHNEGWFWDGYEHGTAVLGIVAAENNGYGVTGIASDVEVGVHSPVPIYNVPAAINGAAAKLRFGDIILIEQQYYGPSSGLPRGCSGDQHEMVPVEHDQGDFDAIRNATARGIIVVEAAGNGSMNLDHSRYGGKFNRAVRDSGAILVGAGSASNRATHCFSNAGSRVDVQGWGDSIATLSGFSEVRFNGDDRLQQYTRGFGGTSGASPIVSGAVASLQGIRLARGMAPLSPARMRELLRATGEWPSPLDARNIGPLPNLRRAIQALGQPAPTFFLHRASATNTAYNQTNLDHPALNNNPGAIVTVTHNWNPPGASGRYLDKPVGVYFTGGRWAIFTQDGSTMPTDVSFNVSVGRGFRHVASAPDGNSTVLNHLALNDNPGAILQVTQTWDPHFVYNNHPVGVAFDAALRRWRILNLDGQPIPVNASFNVAFVDSTAAAFVHTVSGVNRSGHMSRLDHPMLNGLSGALVSVTASGGRNVGVWFDGSNWWLYNENTTFPMVDGTRYHIEVHRTLHHRVVRARESDFWVNTGLSLQARDRVVLSGYGEIGSGVFASGRNGPEGWVGWSAGTGYPLPGAHRYSLIGSAGASPFFVGGGTSFTASGAASLMVRTNDDVPGNGDRWFMCRVQVWR